MQYIKKDDMTMKVIKPAETMQETNEYTIDFLKQQEVDILKQKNDFCEARDRELLEIRELIVQAETLGIKSNVETGLVAEQTKEADLIN